MTTVDDIIRKIEAYITDNEFDPANGIGDNFIVWSGEPGRNESTRRNADHITIHDVTWDGQAHLLPEDRSRILAALQATALFSGWSQAEDAARVLATEEAKRSADANVARSSAMGARSMSSPMSVAVTVATDNGRWPVEWTEAPS